MSVLICIYNYVIIFIGNEGKVDTVRQFPINPKSFLSILIGK